MAARSRSGPPSDGLARDPDFAHTGPGTLAGRYLRRFWQPVALGHEVASGHVKPIRIMGEGFTLYRGESGEPHLVAFRCAHRGTQLSTGWVEDDCLRCFYHGWKYDGSGQCVEMPAEDASFPPKVKIKSYTTRDYLGFVFAYLGEGEPPPFPRHREFEGDGVPEIDGTYWRECNYFQAMENAVDEVHVALVHRESAFADAGLNWDLPRITAEETDYGLVQYGTRGDGVVRVSHIVMPNVMRIMGGPGDTRGGWRDAIAWRVPIDDETHRSFTLRFTHLTGADADAYRERAAQRAARAAALPTTNQVAAEVLAGRLTWDDERVKTHPGLINVQDHVSQIGQGRIQDRTHERLGRSDVALLLYRQIFARELRALAAGQPLREWCKPEQLEVTTGVQ